MSFFFFSAASFILLLMISSWVTYFAKKVKIPSTVALVALGMCIAFLANRGFLSFIDDFELTSDMLFYVFLPILLFESAYTIRYKELLRNIRSISALAIISLIVSAFVIAFLLQFILGFLGLEIPFIVTLLFGALISSTDTAAALSIFKELWVPRRLNLIFEWESLFNDGTAIALFLVVLHVMKSQAIWWVDVAHESYFLHFINIFSGYFGSFQSIIYGLGSLLSMVIFGIIIGALVGIIFSKIIQKIRNDTYLEITLSLALAHAAFLIAEAINHFILPVSGIIATVAAAMVLGNYGRYKISPRVEEVMEKYWWFFAFISNNLVFVLVGMLLVNLNVNWQPLFFPIIITIPIVILARAISVYSVFWFLNFLKKEEPVPRSWQHIISWWWLRWWLAVMMVLFIPSDILLADWQYAPHLSIRELLLSLTLWVVLFSVFANTLTIEPLIRYFKINALHTIERFEYIEWRILITLAALEKIEKIRQWGYMNTTEIEYLTKKYQIYLDAAYNDLQKLSIEQWESFDSLVKQVLSLHALGIEKYWLRSLYKNGQISEMVFKRIMKRVVLQIRRVEKWENQIDRVKTAQPKEDIFERITEYIIDRLEPKMESIKALYLEKRTIHMITEKALEGIQELWKIDFIRNQPGYSEIIELYEGFRLDAEKERRQLFKNNKTALTDVSIVLTEQSILMTEEAILTDLVAKEIISPKLARKFETMLWEKSHLL